MAMQSRLLPGFNDPSADSQAMFRALLRAMSRPGVRLECPAACAAPEPLNTATAAAALCLLDHETSVWLDGAFSLDAVTSFLHFHVGARLKTTPGDAAFGLVGEPATMPPLDKFLSGSSEYPERSATLIIQVPSLDQGDPVEIVGPGIETSATICPAGLPDWFWDAWSGNHKRFPLGVDVLFSHGRSFIALPRTAAEK
jgi:alpha-D-ribose 1-methylphosphonate 5-triphosphate synthase subunit PhnH